MNSPLLLLVLACGDDEASNAPREHASTDTAASSSSAETAAGHTGDTHTTEPTTGYVPPSIPCAPEQTSFPHCGCLTFATSIGGIHGDVGFDLASTPSGGVALAGRFGGVVTFGAGQPGEVTLTADSGPYTDGFVAVYAGTGELLWVRQQTGAYYSLATVVAADESSGRVAVAGEYLSEQTLSGGGVQLVLPYEYGETFIASYDSSGTLQWAVYTQSDNNDKPTDLSFGAFGALYLTGYTTAQTLDFISTNGSQLQLSGMGTGGLNGETAGFLLRIEPDGELAWAQALNGSGYQKVERLAVLSDDNVVVGGSFTTELVLDSAGQNETTLQPSSSLFFASYSSNGALLSAHLADGTGSTFMGGLHLQAQASPVPGTRCCWFSIATVCWTASGTLTERRRSTKLTG